MSSSLLFNITTFAYLVSMSCFFVHLTSRNEHAGTAGSYTAYGDLLVQTVAILLRWKETYARYTSGWVGRRSAWLSITGFAATIFWYLRVNLLLSGLHSYGGN